jgi:hypothetical protein
MARPTKDIALQRRHARQVKFNDLELEAWNTLLADMASAAPRANEAQTILWLVEQECRRRGITWPNGG